MSKSDSLGRELNMYLNQDLQKVTSEIPWSEYKAGPAAPWLLRVIKMRGQITDDAYKSYNSVLCLVLTSRT